MTFWKILYFFVAIEKTVKRLTSSYEENLKRSPSVLNVNLNEITCRPSLLFFGCWFSKSFWKFSVVCMNIKCVSFKFKGTNACKKPFVTYFNDMMTGNMWKIFD